MEVSDIVITYDSLEALDNFSNFSYTFPRQTIVFDVRGFQVKWNTCWTCPSLNYPSILVEYWIFNSLCLNSFTHSLTQTQSSVLFFCSFRWNCQLYIESVCIWVHKYQCTVFSSYHFLCTNPVSSFLFSSTISTKKNCFWFSTWFV